ncbi:MAG: hypothetical protein WDZ54_08375 [Sneathiella sp.]
MTSVFISGSRSIKHLDKKVNERIDNMLASQCDVIVGDADGVDTSIQSYLREKGATNVTVFCTGPQPRNNLGNWEVRSVASTRKRGSRAYFTAKDIEMAEAADFGFMVWDTKSTGTLSNVLELLKQKKKSVVFVNKSKEFQIVSDVSLLEDLMALMAPSALDKAETKISMSAKISALRNEQMTLI